MLLRICLIIMLVSSVSKAENILHVSFDITRELFKEINKSFIETHPQLRILQSHGGSGKQTAAIMHGLSADVVSLALPYHMDLLAKKDLVAKNWRELFPNNSSPFSTHIVFLVRKDNPKQIKDWDDLVKPDVKVITANPKTSGGALWNYLAAWIYANKSFPDDKNKSIEYMYKLYNNAPVLDSTARTAAVTFIKRRMGDVLITWDNEAKYIIANLDSSYQIIEPSLTVKIEVPVAVALKKKHEEISQEYVRFLFSPEGQKIGGKYYYQPFNAAINNKNMVNAEDYVNWHDLKTQHFGNDGVFEQIYK
jgi:sulfate/thiosulfate transport system substrate-binding protein